MTNIISQGAEAVIKQEGDCIIKDRIPKSYRIKELDVKIRKQRTKAEAKLLEKASKIINSPKPFPLENDYQIKMPFVEGKKLSDNLNLFPLKEQKEICRMMGKEVAKLHNADIIHGDLTTSNMILAESENNKTSPELKRGDNLTSPQIFIIDFGLGFISVKAEDKAVDLHLLKQAFEARHFQNWEVLFDEFLNGYKNYKEAEKVIERLKIIEKRGRYKHE
ncbi:KEOPS complex subunit Bud32 [uncultured archaeon]|nr:KEOPS complex subunit Bud32 [uncultured archaeon]